MTDQPQQPTPVLTEQRTDTNLGDYTTEWYCDPPKEGISFTVVRSEWDRRNAVRRIYEIKIGDVW